MIENQRDESNKQSPSTTATSEKTVAELAQLVPDKNKPESGFRLPAVPFILVMPLLFICTLLAAIVPSIVTISSTGEASISDATAQIILLTAQSASQSFTQQMKQVMTNTQVAANSPVALNFLSKNVHNYFSDADLNTYITQYVGTVGCHLAYYTRQNHTGLMTEPVKDSTLLNMTYYSSFTPDTICWVDYNHTYSLCDNVDSATGKTSGKPYPNPFIDLGDPALTPVVSLAKTVENCPPNGNWIAQFIYGTTFLAHARCPSRYVGKTSPVMGVNGFQQDPKFFQYSAPAESSRIFLIANENRLIIANQNITVANEAKNDLVEVIKAKDSIIAELGSKLFQKYGGGISKFPEFTSDQLQNFRDANSGVIQRFELAADNGAAWITCALRMTLGDERFVLVVSMPEAKFTGPIAESKKTGVIVVAVVTIVGCAIGLLCTILATWPLRKITAAMAKATNFDFSMLESSETSSHSGFLEIQNLQRTFHTMIKAFAGGIRTNKQLAQKSGGDSGVNSSLMTKSMHGKDSKK